MLTPLAAGVGAFALFILFDINKAQNPARFGGLLFAMGGLLLTGATATLLFPLKTPITPLRTAGAFWAVLWLLLLIYVLFFALPANDVYVADDPLGVCDRGAYALCRHPGGWCLLFGYLGLWFFSGSTRMGVGALLFSSLNFAYIVLQDRWLFPCYIAGYADYRKRVPFLIPNRNSIARCLGKGNSSF